MATAALNTTGSSSAIELEDASLRYFSHCNSLSRHIVSEERALLKYLGSDQWTELPTKHKDDLLDLLFVEDSVRSQYCPGTTADVRAKSSVGSDISVPESFPRLYISSGNKINVDFENDLWTWRDEHSGPFSWMSKSQQDLTLSDLEPENILKPQPKSVRVDTEDEQTFKAAEPQFTNPSSSWCNSVIEEFKKNERSITLTPSTSLNNLNRNTDSWDTVVSDQEDQELSAADLAPDRNQQNSGTPVLGGTSMSRESRKKSPSPKRIQRSGSFKTSELQAPNQGTQSRKTCIDLHAQENVVAFNNPAMESEWSVFMGHSEAQNESPIISHDSSLIRVPVSLTMDRGDYVAPCSPYIGDEVRLLPATDSPALTDTKSTLSQWSAQSTPDHSTSLLRGLQSPVHSRHDKSQSIKFPAFDNTCVDAVEEEVLRVEKEGDTIIVTTEQNKRDSDLQATGFDFLDNW